MFFNEFIGFFRLSLELFHLKFLVIELRVCENLFFSFTFLVLLRKETKKFVLVGGEIRYCLVSLEILSTLIPECMIH